MRLKVEPLTRLAFAPFGDVVEAEGASHYAINQGTAVRFDELAAIDVTNGGGHARLSIVVAQPWPQPIRIEMMERHPLGSQAFIPLQSAPFLIVVAEDEGPMPGQLHAFLTNGAQGVNYRRNVWHHPLLALEPDSRFVVVDRGGEGANLQEMPLQQPAHLEPIDRQPS